MEWDIRKQDYNIIVLKVNSHTKEQKILKITQKEYKPFSIVEDKDFFIKPDYNIDYSGNTDFIQSFVDAAWDAGIRPVQTKKPTGEQEKHLEDMRTIAFKLLKIDK